MIKKTGKRCEYVNSLKKGFTKEPVVKPRVSKLPKLYLAIPVRLEFKLNESKHTVAVARIYEDDIKLQGNVMGAISDCRGGAMDRMLFNVEKYIEMFPSVMDGAVSHGDFVLVYSLSETDMDGSIWTGASVVSTHKFED